MSDMLAVANKMLRKLAELPSTSKTETRDSIAEAQVAATLAVAEEVAKLRDVLADGVGVRQP